MRRYSTEPRSRRVRPRKSCFRKKLLEHRQRLLADIQQETSFMATRPFGDLADQAEIATEAFLLSHSPIWETLRRIDVALEKLDVGGYGMCEWCGRPISMARLRAIPWADLCKRCREREEVRQIPPAEPPPLRIRPADIARALEGDNSPEGELAAAVRIDCKL